MNRMISVVITAFNEGDEVQRTVDSVRENTPSPHEIILVDDGSTDGCCEREVSRVRLVRHPERIGVAFSRNSGCQFAQGDVLAFLDAHQRVNPGCLDACAALARDSAGIVWPAVQNFGDDDQIGYGANLVLSREHGYFEGRWRLRPPAEEIVPITTLICPGYVMSRAVYVRVRWVEALRGWGASEPAIAIKAFFTGVPILHFRAPHAWHLFRKEIPYAAFSHAVWRNQALVARVCFSERTWRNHWLPNVFARLLTPQAALDVESPGVRAEHASFQAIKVRRDREFWTDVLGTDPPPGVD